MSNSALTLLVFHKTFFKDRNSILYIAYVMRLVYTSICHSFKILSNFLSFLHMSSSVQLSILVMMSAESFS